MSRELHIARTYARLFATPDGKAVLDDLQGKTLRRPAWGEGRSDSFAVFRAGQNDVVLMIDALIRQGLSPDPEPRGDRGEPLIDIEGV